MALFSFVVFSVCFALSNVFIPFVTSVPRDGNKFGALSSRGSFCGVISGFCSPSRFCGFEASGRGVGGLTGFCGALGASDGFSILASFGRTVTMSVSSFGKSRHFCCGSGRFVSGDRSPAVGVGTLRLGRGTCRFCGVGIRKGSKVT